MKTPIFVLMCGIGIAGCQQSSDTSPRTSANNQPAPEVTTDATANNSSNLNNSSSDIAAAPATQPDNTAINSRDRSSDVVTAGSQGQNQSDIHVTADIRRRIMQGNLSITAQNVKVICLNGRVTLRGPVNTQDEKDAIGQMANDVAGSANVDNELEIKTNG